PPFVRIRTVRTTDAESSRLSGGRVKSARSSGRDPVRREVSAELPALVRRAVAVPDDQLRAVGGVGPRIVQAAARLRVAQRAVGLRLPLLGTGAVAVPQLDRRAVGGAAGLDVHALADRPQRAAGR